MKPAPWFRVLSVCLLSVLGQSCLSADEPRTAVDFERNVQGLLGRMGCNTGSCHGSFQGKGGLYLSLFGYSPEKDYLALTRDSMGRGSTCKPQTKA